MKRKICAVLFAAVLGLFFAPLGTFAFASGGGGGGIRPAELPDRLESLGDLTFDSWDEADDYYQSLGAAVARYLHITDLGNIPTYWACKVATTGLKVLYPPACSYAYALDEETKELIKFMLDDGSTTVIGDEPPTISTNAFSEVLLNQNNTLTPKNRTMYKYSWRELSNTQLNYLGDYLARAVGNDGNFFDDISFEDGVYIQPYVIMGDVKDTTGKSYRGDYYTPYQYRLYCEKTEAPSGIDYDFEYHWKFDALHYQIDDGERLDIQTNELGVYYADYQFVNLGFWHSGANNCIISVYFYDELIKAKNSPYASNASAYIGSIPNTYYNGVFLDFLLSSDTSICLNTRNILSYFHGSGISSTASVTKKTLSDFQSAFPADDISDYGLLFSNSPFSTTYTFDITRLPENATVTISGDSVYDYSITDNSTGDTSTIYNYVTNNYNYPQSSGDNTSGGGNGGGNIGGNIIVGGQVDVGGKVEIDVNINGGGNGGNYSMPDTSDMDDFLENALDDSSGFRKFLKDFFDFLPPPILALLGTALTCAIIARLLGR